MLSMNESEKRVTESLAHAKDAAAVLSHVNLSSKNPAEAGVQAEIQAADELLEKGIEKLKAIQAESDKK